MKESFYDKHFKQADLNNLVLMANEFEDCHFKGCQFLDKSFEKAVFIDCTFSECDLSNASLKSTSLKSVIFEHCKLNGIHFEFSNPFMLALDFKHCQMHYTSFYAMNLENVSITDCSLKESDFTEVDAQNRNFKHCDFLDCIFDNSILIGSDFTSAVNYRINPTKNQIKKAKFSVSGLIGLVSDLGIEII